MEERELVLSLQDINNDIPDATTAGWTVLTWTVTVALSTISNSCG